MNKHEADRFNHDVDHLLNEAGLSEIESASPEYEELLDVARLLTKADFSEQSRIRHSLRRRLLDQIEESLVTTADLPGPFGIIKNLFKSSRDIPSPPPARPGFSRMKPVLTLVVGVIIVGLILATMLSIFGPQRQMATLLRPLLPEAWGEVVSGHQSRILSQQWQFTGEGGISTPPLVGNGQLYVGSNSGTFYALTPSTGQVIWQRPLAGSLETRPALVAGLVYVGSREGLLYALEAATGQPQWQFQADSPITTAPTVAGDALFLGDEAGTLYALDAATGREKWRFQTDGAILSPPLATHGTVYFGSNDWHLYALDAATGREMWRFRAEDWLTATPVFDEASGMVYIGSHDQRLYALDAATGQEWWRFEAGDNIVAGATVAGGRLYVGSYDGYLYALDTATGQTQWRFWTGKAVQAVPVVVDDLVYIGSGEGYLYAIETATGQLRQWFEAGSQLYTAPVVSEERIYLTTGKGQLFTLRAGAQMPPPIALLTATTTQTYTVQAARFHFTPDAWFPLKKPVDDSTRFRGRLVDGTGQPVSGFVIEADNGRRRLLSEPSNAEGNWEIVVAEDSSDSHWWWLTVGQNECGSSGDCRFTHLSESVKVEVIPPDQATVNADWICRRDCQAAPSVNGSRTD